MATVEELVNDNDKDELIALAKEYELSTDGNKPDIAERIVKYEAGVPQDSDEFSGDEEETDEPDATAESNGEGQDVSQGEVGVADTQPLDVQEASNDDDSDDDDEYVMDDEELLIYYSGQALRYEIAGVRFSRDNPFRVVSKSVANTILEGPRGDNFRIASPAQAERFYS